VKRWFRSLHAQLLLWAILPVTIAIVATGFTGIYAHQATMRDFVAERNLDLARLAARIVEDGLAHGTVDLDGGDLSDWLAVTVGDQIDLIIVDADGGVLAWLWLLRLPSAGAR